MVIKRLFVGVLVAVCSFAALAAFVPAGANAASAAYCNRESGGFLDFPTWYKYLNPHFGDPDGGGPRPPECILDAGFPEALPAILLAIFEILLRVSGLLAVIFIVYGGFQYLTTTGEPDKAKNARTTITNALVGLMIAMFATVIVNLVGRNIG